MSRIGKSIETEGRLVATRDRGNVGMGSDCLRVWGFFL